MCKDGLFLNYSFDRVFENQHFVIFDLRKYQRASNGIQFRCFGYPQGVRMLVGQTAIIGLGYVALQ